MQIDLVERAKETAGIAQTLTQPQTPFLMHIPLPYDDPLDPDAASDAPLVTTRRALLRVALVAAETATRFAREGIDTDPMAWMIAPRRLFDGSTAIEGCLDREGCLRAIVLHGLSMGLDADPETIDNLADDDDDDDDDESGDEDAAPVHGHDERTVREPKLWTSLLAGQSSGGIVHAFDAVVANDRNEAETRLRARHGGAFTDDLQIIEGFDASQPLAEALVSPALSDMLSLVAADPASPLAEGLSVSVRQRFAA